MSIVFISRNRFALPAFILLALLPVWIIVPLRLTSPTGLLAATLASTLAPTLAALFVTAFFDGPEGLRELWSRVYRRPVDFRWVFLAAAFPAACALTPILILKFFIPSGYTSSVMTPFSRAALFGVPIFAFLEEFGWIGFAMPRLQRKQTSLTAALLVGLIQGLYHLPVFVFNEVPYSLIAALAMTVSFRISLTWIYNVVGRSVLIAALYHTFVNLFQLPTIAGVNPAYVDFALAGGFLIGAVVVLAISGRQLGCSRSTYMRKDKREESV